MKSQKQILVNKILFLLIIIPFFFCNANSDLVKENTKQSSLHYGIKLIKSSPDSKKTLFILTGFGENPDSLVKRNKLFSLLLKQQFDLAFINIAPHNQTLYLGQTEIDSVIREIEEFVITIKEGRNNFSLVGFSIGGSVCLKLLSNSAFCTKNNIRSCVVIDPPLDMERLFNSLLRQNKFSKNNISKNESEFLLNFMKDKYDLTTTTKPDIFQKKSIFSFNDSTYNNYKKIRNKNILIFTNNDSAWQRVYRDRLPIDMNITDCIPFYEKIKGNNNVKLFVTKKSESKINSHSWDNVDESILINWIK